MKEYIKEQKDIYSVKDNHYSIEEKMNGRTIKWRKLNFIQQKLKHSGPHFDVEMWMNSDGIFYAIWGERTMSGNRPKLKL